MELDILIIDNDQVNSFVLRNIITRNYPTAKVHLCVDGTDGLDHLQRLHDQGKPFPQVVLLDIYMPIMDGFEFLEEYNKKFGENDTAIFAMSNSLDKNDQKKANDFNMVRGFITKPLIYNNIQFIVDSLTGNEATRRLD